MPAFPQAIMVVFVMKVTFTPHFSSFFPYIFDIITTIRWQVANKRDTIVAFPGILALLANSALPRL